MDSTINYSLKSERIVIARLLSKQKSFQKPSEEIRLVLHLYWSQTAQIRGRSEDSQSFKIEKGFRQGCVLVPLFFNMYSEELINEALQD